MVWPEKGAKKEISVNGQIWRQKPVNLARNESKSLIARENISQNHDSISHPLYLKGILHLKKPYEKTSFMNERGTNNSKRKREMKNIEQKHGKV